MVVNKLCLLRERVWVVDLQEEQAKATKADATVQKFIYSGRTGGWTGAEGSTGSGRGRGVPFGRSSFCKPSCLRLVRVTSRFSRGAVPDSDELCRFERSLYTSSLVEVGGSNR